MGSGLLSAAVRHQGTRMPGWSRGTQAGEGLPREEEGRGGVSTGKEGREGASRNRPGWVPFAHQAQVRDNSLVSAHMFPW